jgi:septation ring formation regulator EzrA
MPDGKEQWYSNKDLFEQTQKLREELMATNTAIKKYNGLHEKITNIDKKTDVIDKKVDSQVKRCDEVQTAAKTKSGIYDRVLQLWPIIISTIIFILSRL